MGSGLSARLGNQRPVTAGVYGDRSPAIVPAIAAGYWWDAAAAADLGLVTFNIPEGNGNATFSLLQATVASQPSQLTESGNVQLRMRKSTDANPTTLATAAAVVAGWSGPTYFAGWFRLRDAAGDVTGTSILFSHFLATGNQRRASMQYSITFGPDALVSNCSITGANFATGAAASADVADGTWQFVEVIFDLSLALGGSHPADDTKFFVNLVRQPAGVSAPTAQLTALFDASSPIRLCCNAAGACVDNVDWAVSYYGNGIPSLGDREALMRTHAPA